MMFPLKSSSWGIASPLCRTRNPQKALTTGKYMGFSTSLSLLSHRMFQSVSLPRGRKMLPSILLGFFFNWKIIALQCCGGFWNVSKQIRNIYICFLYIHTYIFPFPIPCLQVVTELQAGLTCYRAASHQLPIFHMIVYICQYYFLSLSFLPLLCPPVHCLHLHLHFFFINRFINTVFLDSIHMH